MSLLGFAGLLAGLLTAGGRVKGGRAGGRASPVLGFAAGLGESVTGAPTLLVALGAEALAGATSGAGLASGTAGELDGAGSGSATGVTSVAATGLGASFFQRYGTANAEHDQRSSDDRARAGALGERGRLSRRRAGDERRGQRAGRVTVSARGRLGHEHRARLGERQNRVGAAATRVRELAAQRQAAHGRERLRELRRVRKTLRGNRDSRRARTTHRTRAERPTRAVTARGIGAVHSLTNKSPTASPSKGNTPTMQR